LGEMGVKRKEANRDLPVGGRRKPSFLDLKLIGGTSHQPGHERAKHSGKNTERVSVLYTKDLRKGKEEPLLGRQIEIFPSSELVLGDNSFRNSALGGRVSSPRARGRSTAE